MGKFIICILLSNAILMTSACTLYKSDGRNKIATNESNLVEPLPILTGITPDLTHSYTCMSQNNTPGFLRAPNNVIETPYEQFGFTAFFNQDPNPSVIIYKMDDESQRHDFCRITFNLRSYLKYRDIQNAVRVGVKLIQNPEITQ